MEPISFAAFTLAGLLSTLPAPGEQVSQAVITTHISPAIAGQWEIELDSTNVVNAPMLPKDEQLTDTMMATRTAKSIMEQNESRFSDSNAIGGQIILTQNITVSAANIPQCREIYNFGEDNKMWAVSGKEWTYGGYIVTHLEEGLPVIALQTIYDNNEKDCLGNQIDQSNDAFIAFLKHKGNKMQWCADSSGEECFASFNRVLP